MRMQPVDWFIVLALLVVMTTLAVWTKRYTRSVADFLAAGRTAGRYVLTVSEGAAMLGAISIVGFFEQFYEAGFSPRWWTLPNGGIMFLLALTGWVIYRFRQTRAMTMAQFFEMRYGRRFRIFAGMLAFTSGIINFGIFPAVGARFFIYFCGLPHSVSVFGLVVSTYVLVMILLLVVALFFTFMGGQIAVIVTDFVQGTVVTVMLLVVFVVLARQFSWTQITEALSMAQEKASLVNPFDTTDVEGFDIWFFLIGIFGNLYMYMTWQGTQGYNCSARTPHEARMGRVLATWRTSIQEILLLFIPVCVYTFLHHPDFAAGVSEVDSILGGIGEEQIAKQVRVPVALSTFLPVGVMGGMCAVMLAAFISTHDTYLHSWGSIFIQDVLMPFRKQPFKPKQHLWILRLSIAGVAVFIFCFSLLFRQTDFILMFFAITGAVYLGGAGSVVIGGLYWKRGSTAGAWGATITCSTLAIAGMTYRIFFPESSLDGQRMLFVIMLASIAVYVSLSLLSRRPPANLDRILHRGQYAIADDVVARERDPARGWRALLIGKEFSRSDKVIYAAFFAWIALWFLVFAVGTVWALTAGVEFETWMAFWRFNLWFFFVLGIVTAVWFTVGGIRDIRDMFRRLRTATRDDADDGMVIRQDDDANGTR